MPRSVPSFQLTDGEQILASSGDHLSVFQHGGFILTNKRVLSIEATPLGVSSDFVSFDLDKLDSIESKTLRPLAALVIGLLCIVGGPQFFNARGMEGVAFTIIGVGVLSFLWYIIAKKHAVVMRSGRSEIALQVSADVGAMQELVLAIDQARSSRLESLRKNEGSRSQDQGSAGTSQDASVEQRLRRLDGLLDTGAIDNDEYRLQRARILESL
jgi:hypothetical protein